MSRSLTRLPGYSATRLPVTRLPVGRRLVAGLGVLLAGIVEDAAADPVFADSTQFALLEFRVTGNGAFFDDFEDGSFDTPPTSLFTYLQDTVVSPAFQSGGLGRPGDENVLAFTKMRDLFQRKFTGGVDSKLGMLRAEASLATSAATIPELERRIVEVENQLSVLLGRAPGPIARGRTLLEQSTPPQIPAGVPAQLLERRPDILEAEQTVVAANALVGVSISEFLPRIGLTGLVGGVSTDLQDVLQKRNALWSIAGVATTPIFQGGAIYYGWEEAKARWEEASLRYESTVLGALREVSDALTAREKLALVREQQALAVESLQESVRISMLRYTDGKASYFEVLNAQQDLFPAQTVLAQTERDQLVAIVQIYRALGGGWSQYAAPQPAPTP